MARLDRLRKIELQSCGLTIQPEYFETLPELEYLDVSGNVIPKEATYESLCNLSNLRFLRGVAGIDPFLECIDHLTQLEHLEIAGNYFEFRGIWKQVYDCRPLPHGRHSRECVQFEVGSFVDTVGGVPDSLLLSSIGNLYNLRHLSIWNMGFRSIPSWIGQLTNLEELSLGGLRPYGGNPYIGPIPKEIGQLRNLKKFGVVASGPLPPEIGQMESLETLHIIGPYTSSGARKGQEEGYDLADYSLEEGQQEEFWINGGYLYKYTLEEINNFPALDGPLPPEWGNLRNLKWLSLEGYLSGSLPPEWGFMTNLEKLYLGDLELSGPIPATWGHMSELKVLDLKNNILSGPLPAEIGDMTSLVELRLNNNLITGPVPPEIDNLGNLEELYLGGNQLTGSIPTLSGMRSLVYLILGDNQLSGRIPSPFPSLWSLEYLSLRNNQFTGPFPDISGLVSLRSFTFEGNDDLEVYGNDLEWKGCIPQRLLPPKLNHHHLEYEGNFGHVAVCRNE